MHESISYAVAYNSDIKMDKKMIQCCSWEMKVFLNCNTYMYVGWHVYKMTFM